MHHQIFESDQHKADYEQAINEQSERVRKHVPKVEGHLYGYSKAIPIDEKLIEVLQNLKEHGMRETALGSGLQVA